MGQWAIFAPENGALAHKKIINKFLKINNYKFFFESLRVVLKFESDQIDQEEDGNNATVDD